LISSHRALSIRFSDKARIFYNNIRCMNAESSLEGGRRIRNREAIKCCDTLPPLVMLPLRGVGML
jgi:hypothetical protein